MPRVLMSDADVEKLNAAYSVAVEEFPGESTHTLTYDIAIDSSLELVESDDQSGWLFQKYPTGELVYGWESGGFSTWNIAE